MAAREHTSSHLPHAFHLNDGSDSDSSNDTHSANAPEIDHGAQAPELYPLPEGLQRPIGVGPEIAPDKEPPFPLPEDVNPKEVAVKTKRSWWSRVCRRKWYISVCVLIVVVAISLGVGLGVGLSRQRSSAPATLSMPAQQAPNHGVMNDSSLSAILTSDGNRHLFFQDMNGTLRHTVFSRTLDQWLPTVDFILGVRQPRNHTPLSVIEMNDELDHGIFVYYIDVNDTLAVAQYPAPGPADVSHTLGNNTVFASKTARSLGISLLQSNPSKLINDSTTTSWYEYLLFYQDPSEQVIVLNGNKSVDIIGEHGNGFIYNNTQRTWQNVTDKFAMPSGYGGSISAPFSIANSTDSSGPVVTGLFFNPHSRDQDVNIFGLRISTTSGAAAPQISYTPIPQGSLPLAPLSNLSSDLIAWREAPCLAANGSFYGQPAPPRASFPFGRLASITSNTTQYLYHQLNESVLVEELQDADLETEEVGWGEPTVLAIPTS